MEEGRDGSPARVEWQGDGGRRASGQAEAAPGNTGRRQGGGDAPCRGRPWCWSFGRTRGFCRWRPWGGCVGGGGGGEGGEERGGEERLVTFSEHPQGSTHSTHAQHAQHAAPRTSRSSRPQPSSFAVRVWQSTHPLLPVLSHGCELVAPACRHGKGRGGSAAEGG